MAARPIRFALVLLALIGGCERVPVERVEWPVMGTIAAVQTKGDLDGFRTAEIVAATKAVFNDVETRLNAHSPTSELSRLAALPKEEILRRCARVDYPCYESAFMLSEVSEGAFNPRWRGENRLDLGAIAKGFAVDLAYNALLDGLRDVQCLVDLGCNLRSVRGSWRTGVKDPNGDGIAAIVDLRDGEALATSATYYRGGHIFDGRTGKPVDNGVVSVTVLSRSAMLADGLSTTLFVLGPDKGRIFVRDVEQRVSSNDTLAVLWILVDGSQVKIDPDSRFCPSHRVFSW